MTSSLPDLLRELREARGKTLRETARELGLDPAYLSRVERGHQSPSASALGRAASYYELDTEQLELAAGKVPQDIAEILLAHPELIAELRGRYGAR